MQYMDAHSRGAFPDFAGYLRQEGLLDGSADALVDSGWVGSNAEDAGRRPSIFGAKKAVWRDITGVCMNCLPERTLPCITAFILIRIIFCGERFFLTTVSLRQS